MSLRSLLTQQAIPYFRSDGAEDEYGHPVPIYTAGDPLPCNLQVAKSMGYRTQERANPKEAYPMWLEYEFYFEYGVTLRERDRFLVGDIMIEIDLMLYDASGKYHHLEGQGHQVRAG